jgi:hypothetical protein
MYICKSLVELMTWHKDGASANGLITSVIDFVTWKHIFTTWLEFVIDAHNVILELALDGVHPFVDLSTCHFT